MTLSLSWRSFVRRVPVHPGLWASQVLTLPCLLPLWRCYVPSGLFSVSPLETVVGTSGLVEVY
jgi:hypothetical protein